METESGAEYISPTHVRHIMRYVKACRLLEPGMSVIDAACGTGYGTAIIARTNPEVIGLDLSTDAIAEAERNYPELKFAVFNLLGDEWDDLYTEAVVSIETIEHFSQHDITIYLGQVRKMLPVRGKFVLTTPYCTHSGPSPITKQHLHEFSLTDLEITLTDAGFAIEAIYPERHEGQAGRLGYCMVHAISR